MSASVDVARRFSSVYTGALTDVLDRRGHLQQTLPSELVPLRRRNASRRSVYPVLGHPHPARLRPIDPLVVEMLGAVPAGHVAVYQCNDRLSARLGELSVTSPETRFRA